MIILLYEQGAMNQHFNTGMANLARYIARTRIIEILRWGGAYIAEAKLHNSDVEQYMDRYKRRAGNRRKKAKNSYRN